MDKTAEHFINEAAKAVGLFSGIDKNVQQRIKEILISSYELGAIEGELKAKKQALQDLSDINQDMVVFNEHN